MRPRLATLALIALAAAICAACTDADVERDPGPNAQMFRDFLDGKFDGAGHPLNARVTEAESLCPDAGASDDSAGDGYVQLERACIGPLAGTNQVGSLVASVRLRVNDVGDGADEGVPIVRVTLTDADGSQLGEETLMIERLREPDAWIDVALWFTSWGEAATIAITPADGARVDVDYVELFPRQFKLVVSPGSGVIGDADLIEFEIAPDATIQRLLAGDADLAPRLDELLASGVATRVDTAYRRIIRVPVGALVEDRPDVVQLKVKVGADSARVELRRSVAACTYEGAPSGTKVLVTAFQPFPADGWHDNVSEVAVSSIVPSRLRDAQVMRLVLPVEYDRAAAAVVDAIARCAPDIVLSFGQGGDAIALEQIAYNLKDTGEVSGGVPDNRGIIAAALPIEAVAPPERMSSLPLEAIDLALRALGEFPEHSVDPGRYICNNVFFAETGAIEARGSGIAGFIHLPYTTGFDDATRARYAAVVEAAINAAVAYRTNP